MQATCIAEIKKQRQRLRNDMSEAAFKTWHAQTLVVLEWIPGITHLQRRFSEVLSYAALLENKIRDARQILNSVIQCIQSPLFGASNTVPAPLSQPGGFVIVPQMTQVQSVTQSIGLDLEALLNRVDEYPGLSPEDKEEAKSLVRRMCEQLTGRAKDVTIIADIATRLTLLGINIHQLFGA